MADYTIADEGNLSDGDRIIVELEGKEICVFRLDGEYYAYNNWCVHQGGPVCEGSLSGTARATFDRDSLELEFEWIEDDNILNCPWHGWEFDVRTGECLSRGKAKLVQYPVRIEKEQIIVSF